MAALALLFAIHSYRPAPFFVMDEVDAALDNVNVLKVCNYIQRRSGDFQCIVISLKDMFYERSQALVGICKDVATTSSRTLTLDLTRFVDVQQETIMTAAASSRNAASVQADSSTAPSSKRGRSSSFSVSASRISGISAGTNIESASMTVSSKRSRRSTISTNVTRRREESDDDDDEVKSIESEES